MSLCSRCNSGLGLGGGELEAVPREWVDMKSVMGREDVASGGAIQPEVRRQFHLWKILEPADSHLARKECSQGTNETKDRVNLELDYGRP